ncbi:glycyl-tRNA synthetase beta chain [Sphingomonas guangdongensis]|uniref:Glycine--tRNA ligase beta subunit n=1 Tax=Sphingomonas guangdongensis TaxID=1141890 RepID=A0A285Q9L8_9SPHN|nr:glycine--tRNA ligase subunit beta [Sphingomonas guangdongensis]SOB78521.1 glycyl-tRNA synthetase beta chain [Sphingomonas guangdongensis]
MTDFLLELRSEEIPARMQARAREDLARLFAAELAKAGLTAGDLTTYATPRRLALIARDLPDATEAVSEELKGPRSSAPPQALDGFLRKTGLTADQLTERDGVYYAVIERPGRATADVLAEAIPAIVRAFPWPKSMRWGDASLSTESLRWVRPLQGIVALFGDVIVPCEVAGIASGAATVGHRFHHPGVITIGSAADYVEKLRACHVIVDQDEREGIIATGATTLAAQAGLTLIRDEGLLAENAGLIEWPVPLLGRFDPDFLSVPPEVIQLTARVNQKYFVCQDGAGRLANAFICVANIEPRDGGAKIVEGNRKVLAARLSDARFFYETDQKTRLENLTPKLEKIVFHEKLGTVADKVDRVAKLARWLVEEGMVGRAAAPEREPFAETTGDQPIHAPEPPAFSPADRARLADQVERAARLAKADLVTGMVGEFPELQGLMGGYYAAAQGEDSAVAAAVRDHYKPVGQGDEVPTDPVTVAVSLADKLDSITQFFAADLKPSGSKDPFALRRSALGVIALILDNRLRFPLGSQASGDVLAFFADRLKVQQREAGVRHDLIDAVFALGGEDDLVRLLARVHALQAFVATDDGANLLAGYKRAANILKKEGYTPPPADEEAETRDHQGVAETGEEDPLVLVEDADFRDTVGEWAHQRRVRHLGYDPEPAELALIEALDRAEPLARIAVEQEDFARAMAALAELRAPIDAFFESVTVNDPDPARREARLGLLARVRAAVHAVADFSKIEG